MRLVFISLLLLLLPNSASAKLERRSSDEWRSYREAGCIGGSTCSDRRLRVPLEDRPVVGIRFHAHDQIGAKAGGALRVKIDGTAVNSYIDIPRTGETFTLDVDEIRGRFLVFETATDDEVEIRDVAVLYGRERRRENGGRIDRDRGGWRSYPRAEGCIGGDQCRSNGRRIMVALESAPVIGIRFHARDDIGARADGKLNVRIDDEAIESYVDVQRAGRRHELEVENIRGSRLVIETANDDEVHISEVEVLYGRARRWDGDSWEREAKHDGGCIGGEDCGGSRARIRVAISGRVVESVRFYARDDIGTRAGGELRIRVDDEVLRNYLDIPREGRVFTIDGRGVAGEYLIIEPAEDDEVVVRDIRITFAREE